MFKNLMIIRVTITTIYLLTESINVLSLNIL